MNKPQRIISLVPSQTELLHSLGLDEEIVGITKFCVHPQDWNKTKTKIGGTKNVDVQKILALKPDLVIANKEENVKEQVEELQQHTAVHVTDVDNLATALAMIEDIGKLTNCNEKAAMLINDIKTGFSKIPARANTETCAYLIWKKPYMTVGGDTFINDMLQYVNCRNVFTDHRRYPSITIDDLVQAKCDRIFLSSEPYPFNEKHVSELQSTLPGVHISLVDGEMFSWYGSRLLHAPKYFSKLLGNEADS